MNNTLCKPGTHSYGLWKIKDNIGIRTCYKCSHKEELPLTDSIKKQIEKQKQAKIYLKGFTKLPPNDEKIIGSINVMLDDYIHYLDKEQLAELNTKINYYKKTDLIDIENASLLTKLETEYASNIDEYLDTLEVFQNYNQEILTQSHSIDTHLK